MEAFVSIKGLVILAYALMIIFFGIMGLRKTKTFSDFFLGGGSVGPWMTAFTYGTAYFSAVLFIGFAGKIGWSFGYSGLWIALGNALVGVLLVWWFMGPKIKKMSVDYNVSTLAEYFEKRYDSKFLKWFTPVCIFIFFIPYSAAVFMGLSYLFESNFNINYTLALILMGSFTSLYLVLGGYKSMTMLDMAFGIIMIVGVVILVFSTLQKGGGLGNITATLSAVENTGGKLTKPIGPPGFWPLFCLIFLTSVAPFGMPQLIQKFYAIKDRHAIRVGMIASTAFALLIGGSAYFIGATTRFFFTAETVPKTVAGGIAYDRLMPELFANVIPEALSVLILLLILSASMSTLAALILISSSSVVKDLYAVYINPDVSDSRLTFLMRVASAGFVLLSVILAYFKPDTIVTILAISWGAIGSVFLGPFIWGLVMKRANGFGASASAILGLLTCLVWFYGVRHGVSRFSPEAGTLGMMVSLVVCPVFSFLKKPVIRR